MKRAGAIHEEVSMLRRFIIIKKIIGGAKWIWQKVTGSAPLTLSNAIESVIQYLKQYGKCTQPSGVWNTAITQYGKCERRNLPQGYTELDYIQSDGNQYLDLNTTINQDDVIEIEFEITASQNSKNIFGYRASASENNIMLFFGSASNRVVVDFNNSGYAAYRLSYDVSINTRYKAVISKSRRAILAADGTVLAENTTVCSDTISCPSAYLFAASGRPAYASGSPCKVYSCRINGKRNLVGAKDASNVVEMYDKVTDAPFVNAGTGSFTAGATATPTPGRPMDIVTNNGALKARHQSGLPLGYTLLDYTRSSGGEFIDLGYKGNGNTKVEVKFRYYTSSSATGSGRVFGSRATSTSNAFAIGTSSGIVAATATNKLFWCYDAQSFFVSDEEFELNVWKTVVFSATEHSIDGVSVGNDYNIVEFQTPQNLKLFGFDNNGTMGTGYVDVEYCKLWNNGVLIRNLIPAKNASNVVGMYDFVSGQFLANAGTGDFVAGSVVDDPVEIYVDGTPEVLTVSGVNLCNPAYYQGDGWYVGGNNTVANANANGTLLFPCKPNTTYSWWHTAGSGGCRAFELSTDTVTQGQEATWAVGNPAYNDANVIRKYTTSASAKLLCVCFGRDAAGVGRTIAEQLADFMLVEGDITTATPYEPYVTPQTVNDVPMLLSVGDYKDEQELIAGLLTHKVGVYVVTGEENLTESANTDADGNKVFQFSISGKAYGRNNFIVTHYAVKNNNSYTGLHAGECQGGGASNVIYFDGGTATNATEFKAKAAVAYASGNPWIVVYELATETTESMTAYPQLCNKLYNTASVTAEIDNIQVTFTTGEQTTPNPYSPLPIVCNNGELKWNGTAVVADGTPEVLTVTGQNLVDLNAVTDGYFYNPSGVYTAAPAVRLTDYIPVRAGQTYTVYVKAERVGAAANVRYNLFNSAKEWKSQSSLVVNSGATAVSTITPIENGFLRVSANYSGTGAKVDWSALQIVYGEYTLSTMPTYEPYVAPQTASVENLFAVGDYKDEAEIIGGDITRKTWVVVFDGTENWAVYDGVYYVYTDDLGKKGAETGGAYAPFATRFKAVSSGFSNLQNGEIEYTGDTSIELVYSGAADLAAFKAKLAEWYAAGDPMIVVYPAPDRTETTTAQPLTTSEGTNTVSVTSNVDPVELEIEYAQKKS